MNPVKDYTKSAAFLVKAILLAVFSVSFLLATIAAKEFVGHVLFIFSDNFAQDIKIADSFTILMIVMASVMQIPMLLGAASYFIIWLKSRSASPQSQPTMGLKMLNIASIIKAIWCFAFTAALAIMFIVQIGKVNDIIEAQHLTGSRADDKRIPLIVIMVLSLIAGAVIFLIAMIQKSFIGGMKRSAVSGELEKSGATAFGVFSVLSAISLFLPMAFSGFVFVIHGNFTKIFNISNTGAKDIQMNLLVESGAYGLFFHLFVMLLSLFIMVIVDAKLSLSYDKYVRRITFRPFTPVSNQPVLGQQTPPQPVQGQQIPSQPAQNYYTPNAGYPAPPIEQNPAPEDNPYRF